MSDISTVYDAIITRVEAVLTSHKRLSNPYKPDENSEKVLNKGYGVRFGPGVNTNRQFNKLSVERTFGIVLTRRVYATEQAASKKASTEKSLFEDQKLILEDIEGDPTLGTSVVVKAAYTEDSGLEFVFVEKDNFLSLESIITVEYFEDISC